MKKLISLVLSLLMLFSLAACGSADSETEETTVDAAEKVAAYVEANQEKLVEPYETITALLTQYGMTVKVIAVAEERDIVLKFIPENEVSAFNELLKLAFPFMQPSSAYFSNINQELPELEGIKIRFCDSDGSTLFEQSYKPQLKTDTDAQ